MSSGAPFVTHGSTPLCDACGEYYSERRCEDCGQHQCTWCNLDIHQPIGKRNHWRPRLYGEDPHAELERNATASADQAVERATRGLKNAAGLAGAAGAGGAAGGASSSGKDGVSSSNSGGADGVHNKYTFDATTGRLNVTSEFLLPGVSPEDGWDLLGDWDAPFLPFPCDVNGDRRVLVLPIELLLPGEDEEGASDDEEDESGAAQQRGSSGVKDTVVVTERLIQRSERDMFYSYSRATPPDAPPRAFPYTELLSKFAFLPASAAAASSSSSAGTAGAAVGGGSGGGNKKQCLLQWTTSVLPRDPQRPRRAAESVARYQEAWRPYLLAALESDD